MSEVPQYAIYGAQVYASIEQIEGLGVANTVRRVHHALATQLAEHGPAGPLHTERIEGALIEEKDGHMFIDPHVRFWREVTVISE